MHILLRLGGTALSVLALLSLFSLNQEALAQVGQAKAWGQNDLGQLGDGSAVGKSTAVNVSNMTGVKAIAGGWRHTVALKTDGTVWAWGDNVIGQFGNGTTTPSNIPVQVPNLAGVVAISAGDNGHVLALKADGTVWAWGNNTDGQIGDGTTNTRLTPVQVGGLFGVKAIAAGGSHSLAVLSDGTVKAWGWNKRGQLGVGSDTSSPIPVTVQVISGVKEVSAGLEHSLALKTDGTVWAWGYNFAGQLGDGTTAMRSVPVQVSGISTAVSLPVSTSTGYYSMAVLSDGTVRAWGQNGWGQLGNGTTDNSATPLAVQGLSGVKAVAHSACNSLALLSDGTVKAWGCNFSGQLGDGTTTERTGPVAVAGLTGIAAIGAGAGHSLAATSNGNINQTGFFVSQHYSDFLNREPDAPGLKFWSDEIENCGADLQCREVKRINVSAAYFLSIEFKETGYLSYRAQKAAYGDLPNKPVPITRAQMMQDQQVLGSGLVVNASGWEEKLEQNKQAYFEQLVASDRFTTLYPLSMPAEQFVDALNLNAGGALSQAERDALVGQLNANARTRAQVLRSVAEDGDLDAAEKNKAFVLLQYFGYLRRNPDEAPDVNFGGWQFWLNKLNEFNSNYIEAEMVKAFLASGEYVRRFDQ